jgi:Zn-dependent protease
MSSDALLQGLMGYACLLAIITFHEFGHAWMASRCGDDTARSLGRVTLNPIAHMDLVGTVILPLLAIYLGATGSALAGFIIGWGKPVPVNSHNLRRPHLDDVLVAMAGPFMNVLLTLAAMIVLRLAGVLHFTPKPMMDVLWLLALLSMYLCFFNLLPIPPLDGSYLLKVAIGMSYETFLRISQFGILIVIVVLQIRQVRALLQTATLGSLGLMEKLLGFP